MSDRRYRTETPNTVVRGERGRGLSVYTKWLYVYIKSVAGDTGTCWQGVRAIAEGAGMSVGKVVEGKRELAAAGLIHITPGCPTEGRSDVLRIVDVWAENVAEFAADAPVHEAEHPVHEVSTPVHHVNTPVHEAEHKKIPVKNKPLEEGREKNARARKAEPGGAEPESTSTFHDPVEAYKRITGRPAPMRWSDRISTAVGRDPDAVEAWADICQTWTSSTTADGKPYNTADVPRMLSVFAERRERAAYATSDTQRGASATAARNAPPANRGTLEEQAAAIYALFPKTSHG